MKAPEIRIAEFVLKDIDSTRKKMFVDANPVCNKENKQKLYYFLLNKSPGYTMDFFVSINQLECEFHDKKPEQACFHVLDLVVKEQYQGTRIDWFNE